MATLWERTPQRLPPAEPLPLRGDSSEGFQGFFSEFCSEKATSSPVFMRELPTVADIRERRHRFPPVDCIAQLHRIPHDRCENLLHISRRAADDSQDFA